MDLGFDAGKEAAACRLFSFTREQRGRGMGSSFIVRPVQAADFSAYWHIRAHNATARRLYDAVAEDSGFVVYRKTML
jgi:hypothetical protein